MAKYILVNLEDIKEQIKDWKKELKEYKHTSWGSEIQAKIDTLTEVKDGGIRLNNQQLNALKAVSKITL